MIIYQKHCVSYTKLDLLKIAFKMPLDSIVLWASLFIGLAEALGVNRSLFVKHLDINFG